MAVMEFNTAEIDTLVGRRELKLNQRARPHSRDGFRHVYGDFYDLGVCIDWHDFESAIKFDWSRSFYPNSLELCLNLAGDGRIRSAEGGIDFQPLTTGFYIPEKNGFKAWREPGQRHRFITIGFSLPFMRQRLAASDGSLHPLLERFMRGEPARANFGSVHSLTVAQEQLVAALLGPPVPQGGRSLWYEGKILQIMAEFFFERRGEDEVFCDRQKRLARERADLVIAVLRKNLAQPPTLEQIGREVGCSPFHLSRTFSKEMGMTIPQHLRKLRMERAAELLQSGKFNVTETALEVGYSSMSHFSQAFCQTMGCCPGLYPLKAPVPATVA